MDYASLIPKVDLLAARTVLVVAPHPDDAAVAAGATLARLAERGAQITVVNVTDGSVGFLDATTTPEANARIREAEERTAAAVLGVADVRFLGLRDFSGVSEREVLEAVLPEIRRIRPDIVLLPDPHLPYEGHPDHRAVGFGTQAAILAAPFPLILPEAGPACGSPTAAFYLTALPNQIVPAEGYWDTKVRALGSHTSQFPSPYLELVAGYLAERSSRWPGGEGPKEAFRVLHPHFLHVNVEAGGEIP